MGLADYASNFTPRATTDSEFTPRVSTADLPKAEYANPTTILPIDKVTEEFPLHGIKEYDKLQQNVIDGDTFRGAQFGLPNDVRMRSYNAPEMPNKEYDDSTYVDAAIAGTTTPEQSLAWKSKQDLIENTFTMQKVAGLGDAKNKKLVLLTEGYDNSRRRLLGDIVSVENGRVADDLGSRMLAEGDSNVWIDKADKNAGAKEDVERQMIAGALSKAQSTNDATDWARYENLLSRSSLSANELEKYKTANLPIAKHIANAVVGAGEVVSAAGNQAIEWLGKVPGAVYRSAMTNLEGEGEFEEYRTPEDIAANAEAKRAEIAPYVKKLEEVTKAPTTKEIKEAFAPIRKSLNQTFGTTVFSELRPHEVPSVAKAVQDYEQGRTAAAAVGIVNAVVGGLVNEENAAMMIPWFGMPSLVLGKAKEFKDAGASDEKAVAYGSMYAMLNRLGLNASLGQVKALANRAAGGFVANTGTELLTENLQSLLELDAAGKIKSIADVESSIARTSLETLPSALFGGGVSVARDTNALGATADAISKLKDATASGLDALKDRINPDAQPETAEYRTLTEKYGRDVDEKIANNKEILKAAIINGKLGTADRMYRQLNDDLNLDTEGKIDAKELASYYDEMSVLRNEFKSKLSESKGEMTVELIKMLGSDADSATSLFSEMPVAELERISAEIADVEDADVRAVNEDLKAVITVVKSLNQVNKEVIGDFKKYWDTYVTATNPQAKAKALTDMDRLKSNQDKKIANINRTIADMEDNVRTDIEGFLEDNPNISATEVINMYGKDSGVPIKYTDKQQQSTFVAKYRDIAAKVFNEMKGTNYQGQGVYSLQREVADEVAAANTIMKTMIDKDIRTAQVEEVRDVTDSVASDVAPSVVDTASEESAKVDSASQVVEAVRKDKVDAVRARDEYAKLPEDSDVEAAEAPDEAGIEYTKLLTELVKSALNVKVEKDARLALKAYADGIDKIVAGTYVPNSGTVKVAVKPDAEAKYLAVTQRMLSDYATVVGDEVSADEVVRMFEATQGIDKIRQGLIDELTKKLDASIDGNIGLHTLVHEFVHAGAVEYMRKFPDSVASKRVQLLYKMAMERKNAKIIATYMDGDEYWKTSADEFLAEALANPRLIAALSSIKVSIGDRLVNVFKELFDTVMKVLGVSKSDTMYTYALDTFMAIVEAQMESTAKTSSDPRFGTKVPADVVYDELDVAIAEAADTQMYEAIAKSKERVKQAKRVKPLTSAEKKFIQEYPTSVYTKVSTRKYIRLQEQQAKYLAQPNQGKVRSTPVYEPDTDKVVSNLSTEMKIRSDNVKERDYYESMSDADLAEIERAARESIPAAEVAVAEEVVESTEAKVERAVGTYKAIAEDDIEGRAHAKYAKGLVAAIDEIVKPDVEVSKSRVFKNIVDGVLKVAAGEYNKKQHKVVLTDVNPEASEIASAARAYTMAPYYEAVDESMDDESFMTLVSDPKVAAKIDEDTKTSTEAIVMLLDEVRKERGWHAAAHEFAHAGVKNFMDENPEHELTVRMNKLYKYVADRVPDSDEYWLTNVDEFVAGGLTNPAVMRRLSTIGVENEPLTGYKITTVFRALYRIAAEMLGIKSGSNAFTDLYMTYASMIKAQKELSPRREVTAAGTKVSQAPKDVLKKEKVVKSASIGKFDDYRSELNKLVTEVLGTQIKTDDMLAFSKATLENLAVIGGAYAKGVVTISTKPNQRAMEATAEGIFSQWYTEESPYAVKYQNMDEDAVISALENDEVYSKLSKEHTPKVMAQMITEWSKVNGAHTLAHELVHVGSSEFMKANPEHVLTKRIAELYKEAIVSKDQILKMMGNDADASYWASSVDEFVAEGLSNPKLVYALKNVRTKVEGKFSNLLKELVSTLLKMLGIKEDGNVYEYLLDGYVAMVESIAKPSAANEVLDSVQKEVVVKDEVQAVAPTTVDLTDEIAAAREGVASAEDRLSMAETRQDRRDSQVDLKLAKKELKQLVKEMTKRAVNKMLETVYNTKDRIAAGLETFASAVLRPRGDKLMVGLLDETTAAQFNNVRKAVEKALNVQVVGVVNGPTMKESPALVLAKDYNSGYSDEVIDAITMSVIQYIAERFGDLRNNDDMQIRKMLGVDDDVILPKVVKNKLKKIGRFESNEAAGIGRLVMKHLGVATKADVDADLQERMESDFGVKVIAAMETMGLLQRVQEVSANQLGWMSRLVDGELSETDTDVMPQMIGTQAVATIKMTNKMYMKGAWVEYSKKYQWLADKIDEQLSVEKFGKAPRFRRTSGDKKFVARNAEKWADLTSEQNEALNVAENTAFKVRGDRVALLRGMWGDVSEELTDSQIEVLKLFGWEDEKLVQATFRDDVAAKNDAIKRSIEALIEFSEVAKNRDVYFDYFFSKNGRLFIDSTKVNPQTDKLHRFMIDVETENKTVTDETVNTFKTAIVQAFDGSKLVTWQVEATGEDIDTGTYEIRELGAADKQSTEDNVEQFEQIIKNEVIKRAVDNPTAENVIAALKGAKHPGHAIAALMELRKYKEGKKFDTNMTMETDGTNSGFLLGLMSSPVMSFNKLKFWVAKGGVWFDKVEARTFGEWIKQGNKDGYTEGAAGVAKVIGTSLDGTWQQRLIGKIDRALMKSPLMTFIYGAGKGSISRHIGTSAADKLIKDLATGNYENSLNAMIEMFNEAAIAAKDRGLAKYYLMLKRDAEYVSNNWNVVKKMVIESEMNADANTRDITDKMENLSKEHQEVRIAKLLGIAHRTAVRGVKNTYGRAIGEYLENEFAEVVAVRKHVNRAFEVMFSAFKAEYDVRVAEMTKEAGRSKPTKAMTDKVLQDMVDEGKVPGIMTVEAKKVSQKAVIMKEERDRVEDSKVVSKLKSGNRTVHPLIYKMVANPTAGAVVNIHFLDGAIIAKIIRDANGLGVHDAWVTHVNEVAGSMLKYNKAVWELTQAFNMTERVLEEFKKVMDENSEDDIATAEALTSAAETVKLNKELMRQQGARITQMAGPAEGVYEVAAESKVVVRVADVAISDEVLRLLDTTTC